MRGLIVNLQSGFGGGEKYISDLCRELAERGFHIALCTPKNDKLEALLPASVKVIYGYERKKKFISITNFISYLKMARIIKKVCSAEGFDFILLNGKEGLYLANLIKSIICSKIAVIHTVAERNSFIKEALNRKSLTNVDRAICVSQLVCESYTPVTAVDKLVVVNNGVDTSLISNSIRTQRNLGDKLKILSVSRLSKDKGQEDLIRLAKKLACEDIDFEIMICGDGECKDVLVELGEELGVSDYLTFSGFISPTKLYTEFDIFVFTSRLEESFGLVILEAMIGKIPIVSTPAGAVQSILDNEKYGYIYNSGDIEQLFEIITNFLRCPLPFLNKAELAASHAVVNYSLKSSIDDTIKVIRNNK